MITKIYRLESEISHTKTWTVPAEQAAIMLAAFARSYKDTIPDPNTGSPIANPMTRDEFAISRFDRLVKAMVDREIAKFQKEQVMSAMEAQRLAAEEAQ